MNRTIQHPDIEFQKYKDSYSGTLTDIKSKSTVLTFGFSRQGQYLEPTKIDSINNFNNSFGSPETEEQEYFYSCVKGVLSNYGLIEFVRIPYNNSTYANKRTLGIKFDSSATENISASLSDLNQSRFDISGIFFTIF